MIFNSLPFFAASQVNSHEYYDNGTLYLQMFYGKTIMLMKHTVCIVVNRERPT